MNLSFFPIEILNSINKINTEYLYEIRLRENYPVIVNYSFKRYFLSNRGLCNNSNDAIIVKKEFIENILKIITEYSIYAFNDRIKQGYMTIQNGIRVGISGECVFDNDKIITIKNVTSLLIRIPHEIIGSASTVYSSIINENDVLSTLICSPPFCGKTTILKDLVRLIDNNFEKSILVIDERGEFENVKGINVDKIRYSDKLFAFNTAIRSLAPEIVVTDELSSKDDFTCVQNAINSGVKIIASCHAGDVDLLKRKLNNINNLFDRYVFLKKSSSPGQVDKIFDRDFNLI